MGIHGGKYETQIANIHGYKDDDYTLWRLKEKQLKTLEDLHNRKAKFIVNEACRVKEREDDLLHKINSLDKKVQKAERFFHCLILTFRIHKGIFLIINDSG